jgi:hypothetical protein
MARKRHGYKGGRGAARRMRARNRGYGGSARTAGRAKRRMAHDWTVGVWR